MPLVKVLRNGQITMPKKFREVLGIKDGDVLEANMGKDKLVLKPKFFIDRIPASELSPKGIKKVEEALSAYEKGEVKEFDNIDDLINDLNS